MTGLGIPAPVQHDRPPRNHARLPVHAWDGPCTRTMINQPARNLTKYYGRKAAVDHLSFTVEPAQRPLVPAAGPVPASTSGSPACGRVLRSS